MCRLLVKTISLTLALHALILFHLPKHKCSTRNYTYHFKGYYAGWIGNYNIGDELLLDNFANVLADSLRQQASALGNNLHVSLEYQPGGIVFPHRSRRSQLNFSDVDFAVLGGGSVLERVPTFWSDFCREAKYAKRPLYLHGSGMQVPEDRVKELASLACVQHPAFGGLRGPLTQKYTREKAVAWAQADGLGSGNVTALFNLSLPVIGDPAILTGRFFQRQITPVVQSVDRHRSPEGVVCLSYFERMETRDTASRRIQSWAVNYTVILLPMELSMASQYAELHREVLSHNPALKHRVFLLDHMTNYGAWLALLDRCSIMVTNRLHAVVLSAATQTPFRIIIGRGNLKHTDYILQNFGEDLESFRFQEGLEANERSVPQIGRLLRDNAQLWQARYNEVYEQRTVDKAYAAHTATTGVFLSRIVPSKALQKSTDVRVVVQRFWDIATIDISFR